MSENRTVFIVDDDEIYTFTLKSMMEGSNCTHDIMVYEDGASALEALTSSFITDTVPDVIFLDLDMPHMNGWEFLDELSKLQQTSLPAIYISSSTIFPEELERAKKNVLVTEFISKPISKEKLAEVCSKLKELDDQKSC